MEEMAAAQALLADQIGADGVRLVRIPAGTGAHRVWAWSVWTTSGHHLAAVTRLARPMFEAGWLHAAGRGGVPGERQAEEFELSESGIAALKRFRGRVRDQGEGT